MPRVVRVQPLFPFAVFALPINLIATYLSGAFPDGPRRPLVAAGAFVDMLVVVPLLYYFLVARRGAQPCLSTLPVLLLSAIRAAFVFPDLVPGRAWIGAGGEIGLLTLVSLRVREGLLKARAAGIHQDPITRIETITNQVIPFLAVSRVLAWELAVFYYALASWWARPDVPAGSRGFSIHKESGFAMLLGLMSGIGVIETAVVHRVVYRLNAAAAWVLTAIGLYGILWLVAMARSIALRPVLVSGEAVEVRLGLLWRLRIPRTAIRELRRLPANAAPDRKTPGYLRISPLADPKFLLKFRKPHMAHGPYGLRKAVTSAGLAMDDGPGFAAAIGLLP